MANVIQQLQKPTLIIAQNKTLAPSSTASSKRIYSDIKKRIRSIANDLDNWGGGYIIIGVAENEEQPVYSLKGVPADKVDAVSENRILVTDRYN